MRNAGVQEVFSKMCVFVCASDVAPNEDSVCRMAILRFEN